jgi:anti-sigma regulatory factor (Ser/Thr protein kinase)
MTPIPKDFVRHLRADGDALASLGEALSEWATQAHVSARTAFHLDLILDELLTNIVEHGVPAQGGKDAAAGDIRIEVRVGLVENGAGLEVHIRDDAQAFNPLSILQSDIDTQLTATLEARTPGGLGIHFVKTLTQALHYMRHPAHSNNTEHQRGYNEICLLMRTGSDASRNC